MIDWSIGKSYGRIVIKNKGIRVRNVILSIASTHHIGK